jgi:hypothetical protein
MDAMIDAAARSCGRSRSSGADVVDRVDVREVVIGLW